jgi:hypothetical protein
MNLGQQYWRVKVYTAEEWRSLGTAGQEQAYSQWDTIIVEDASSATRFFLKEEGRRVSRQEPMTQTTQQTAQSAWDRFWAGVDAKATITNAIQGGANALVNSLRTSSPAPTPQITQPQPFQVTNALLIGAMAIAAIAIVMPAVQGRRS